MGVILELLAWIVFEFIGVILGATVRFVIFKIFKPSLQFDEFFKFRIWVK